jgi:uncharacterized protein (DUF58 family)
MTARGWWLLLVVFLTLALGLFTRHAALPLLGLTLLLWFLGQWAGFAVRSRLVTQCLSIEREVRDERGPVDTLWAGQTYEVRVRLRLDHSLGLPHVAFADWVPLGVELINGHFTGDGPLAEDRPLEVAYRIRCPNVMAPVRFEGGRVQVADLQGFFFHAQFVPGVVLYRVLPVLADSRGRAAGSKRHNLLPPPGVHRLRRPGSGSELLDLRDYLPGDPPKTIAWKVSARRDRLITKEFESEVPLRCTLFVDTSNSVRVGPTGASALGRLLHVSAAVAQANAAARDLTGLCLFDEHSTDVLRPARGARHLATVLSRLAGAASLAPSTPHAPVASLLPLAHAFAQEVYPHLLRREVNRVPFWLPWLWPLPAEAARQLTPGRRVYWWLSWLLSLVPLAFLLVLLGYAVDAAFSTQPAERVVVPPELEYGALVLGLLFLWPGLVATARALVSRFLATGERRLARWRKQLAALLSARYGLAPGGLALLLEDDQQCALLLQRFLAEHHVPYPLPLYDAAGRYLFAAPDKVEVLSRALVQAVGKGHDNELFVLLADLLELDGALEPLLRAVRMALARHHQVVVVCPWPPGVPVTATEGTDTARAHQTAEGNLRTALLPLLDRVAVRRFQTAYQRLRRAFARLGVPVVCAAGEEPVPLILERLERLRMLGRKR